MMQKLRKLNQGSLLQRTLLHVALFVLGSATVVTLASVLLVSTAKAVLPPHDTTETDADKADQEQEEGSDADSSSPEAAAGAAGAQSKTKALARLGNRRESAVAR